MFLLMVWVGLEKTSDVACRNVSRCFQMFPKVCQPESFPDVSKISPDVFQTFTSDVCSPDQTPPPQPKVSLSTHPIVKTWTLFKQLIPSYPL